MSLPQADAMIRACREHGVKLTVISQHRIGTIVGTTAACPGLSARVEIFGSRQSRLIVIPT
ncbi:MAG: hypothetical protein ACYCVB_00810 [Bacilli bacterium]